MGYAGGNAVFGYKGGVIGAFVTMGTIIASDITMFIGAMVMAPIAAYLLKKSLAMDNKRVVGKAFYVDMFGMDPFESVHTYDGDVLIVHGDQDTTVPFEWSERAVKEYAHAELVKVPGARHGFQGEHQKIALAAVEDYVWKHFNA